MGYELRLYIVEPSTVKDKEGIYCSVIAMVDLCNPGRVCSLLDLNSNADKGSYFFYGSDGNTRMVEDCYGEAIRYAGVEEVLEAVIKDNKKEKYRRFDILIACLKAVVKGKFRNPLVAFYGY